MFSKVGFRNGWVLFRSFSLYTKKENEKKVPGSKLVIKKLCLLQKEQLVITTISGTKVTILYYLHLALNLMDPQSNGLNGPQNINGEIPSDGLCRVWHHL